MVSNAYWRVRAFLFLAMSRSGSQRNRIHSMEGSRVSIASVFCFLVRVLPGYWRKQMRTSASFVPVPEILQRGAIPGTDALVQPL